MIDDRVIPSLAPDITALEDLSPDAVLMHGNLLSSDAERLRSWFGFPISMLPLPRSGRRSELRSFVLDVNHLIARRLDHFLPWDLLAAAFPPEVLGELGELFAARFAPLWSEEEVVDLARRDAAGLAAEWHRRSREGSWRESVLTFLNGADLPRVWSELGSGDFDLSGRGRDYTEGMHYFQAARALGIETLLEHLGAFGREGGLILDVLGGDGYILRIFEAVRKLRRLPLYAGECSSEGLRAPLSARGEALIEADGGGLILAIEESRSPRPTARWIALLPSGALTSDPFELPTEAMEALACRARSLPGGGNLDMLVSQAGELAAGFSAAGPHVITNDISPHMFLSAGLWGLPTREDARLLSRTFRARSLDAIIFAYGTHHVVGIAEGIAESFAVLRPGGRVLLQDFLDEGPVGRWFHSVVDPFSRTGHDFVHIGPVQLAVQLFLAGFREVQVFEMEDPFLFAVPEGATTGAREVARTYLLGMYGLGGSHLRERDRLEQRIRQVLSYEEIGNTPRFEDDFVYVPRRATGASAVRPEGSGLPLSAGDGKLAAALSALLALESDEITSRFGATADLLAAWFRADGSCWGLARGEVEAWFELVDEWKRSGAMA